MTPIPVQLREATVAYLERTGRTRSDLAASVRMNRTCLADWLNQRRGLPVRHWAPLAKEIGVTLTCTTTVP